MELTVTERDRVTERVIVALLLGDLVRLSVTLDDRVNGRVVGIPDLLTVTERVRVANIDAGIVLRGEGLTETERERVANPDAGTV